MKDDELLEDDEFPSTLIDRIAAEMATDTDNMAKQSDRLIELYTNADAAGKELLDDAFACLCGWTLATLLKTTGPTDSAN